MNSLRVRQWREALLEGRRRVLGLFGLEGKESRGQALSKWQREEGDEKGRRVWFPLLRALPGQIEVCK